MISKSYGDDCLIGGLGYISEVITLKTYGRACGLRHTRCSGRGRFLRAWVQCGAWHAEAVGDISVGITYDYKEVDGSPCLL